MKESRSEGLPALTREQRAELHAELERELARLDRTMSTSRDAARPVSLDQTSVGRLSRMDALQNQQMSADLHSRNEARHAEIVDALARVANGSYGTCARCAAPIAYGRLLVFPEARLCSACGARES
ncbi:MAG TPA: TraR/DksA C4-type zinc finger protein [Gemmatimonadaceae bacterium]|nr:TraR/DksA C4-type zinc finger protein [Gemmatimonadaceae bacterium]